MSDIITITGVVGTDPRHLVTNESLAITSFRLASTQRRFDRSNQKWIDGDTNWFTVVAFRNLAAHVSASVKKGERVLVTGRLRIREWETDEKSGTNVEIEADAIGHDLQWGTSSYSRAVSRSAESGTEAAEAAADAPGQADGATGDSTGDSANSPARDAAGDLATGADAAKSEQLVGLPF